MLEPSVHRVSPRLHPRRRQFKHLMPPWISFVDRPLVPAAKSSCSTSAVLSPLVAASRATPEPVAPAPMTKMSKSSCLSRSICALRLGAANGITVVPSRHGMGAGATCSGGAC
eukprot:scaffold256_cov261-Pinguiococcus_pyrenoidosus.AAC.53